MDIERVRPVQNPNEVAAEQVKRLLQRGCLKGRRRRRFSYSTLATIPYSSSKGLRTIGCRS
jgi:hypothetical protein